MSERFRKDEEMTTWSKANGVWPCRSLISIGTTSELLE